MPSSLIVVALVVAWLVVLVPMIVRKRQEIARTADSALAARVVHSGGAEEVEEGPMRSTDDTADELDDEVDQRLDEEVVEEPEYAPPPPAFEPFENRRYRPGRGGFDPEAAAVIARAKYAFRQRVVLAMIVGAILTGVFAGVVFPMLWWPHGTLDIALVSYLVYLRRQVRIELEVRERRLARMRLAAAARSHARARPAAPEPVEEELPGRQLVAHAAAPPPRVTHPGAVVVDMDDEDPAFDELETPDHLPYRRAVGE